MYIRYQIFSGGFQMKKVSALVLALMFAFVIMPFVNAQDAADTTKAPAAKTEQKKEKKTKKKHKSGKKNHKKAEKKEKEPQTDAAQ